MSYDTFNKLRKTSETEQGLRASCREIHHKSRHKNVGKTIWYLSTSSLQIPASGSTYGTPCTCCRTHDSHYNQNSQRRCAKTSELRSNQQLDHRRDCNSWGVNFSYCKRIPWLTAPHTIVRFVWNLFLIVTWQKSLSRLIASWFQARFVVWESLLD